MLTLLSLAAKVLDMPKFSTWLASEIAISSLENSVMFQTALSMKKPLQRNILFKPDSWIPETDGCSNIFKTDGDLRVFWSLAG